MIAGGVKGLLSMRRESLVVCALSILQESERRARGCGELSVFECGGAGDWRVSWKLLMRVKVDEMEACRVSRLSEPLGAAMVFAMMYSNADVRWEEFISGHTSVCMTLEIAWR